MRIFTVVGGVHEDCALAHQIAMLLQQDVANRKHKRVTRMKHRRKRRAGLVKRTDGFSGEANALVTLEHGCKFAAVAACNNTVALPDRRRDVRDLETRGLSRMNGATQGLEGFHKER